WHWIFWINVPIGAVATVLARAKLVESRGPATRLDPFAVVLVSIGAASLVWGLVRAGEAGWSDAWARSALALGGIGLASFLVWESRARDPMLPLRLFRSGAFTAANATAFLMSGALNAAAFLIAQDFQVALGYSPLATGLRLLPWTATPLVIAPLAGKVSDRVGRRAVLALGLLLQAIGLAWVATIATTDVDYAQLVAPLVIAGVGISMALPVAPTAALSAVAPSDIGKASGVNSTMQRFGAAFVIAVAAAVFGRYGRFGTSATFAAGVRPALGVVAAVSLLAAL